MRFQKNRLLVRLYSLLMKFAVKLQTLPLRMMPPPIRLMQLASAFWQSRVLYVAARLDIATLLGNDALTSDRIADGVASDPDAVYRLLRMLAATGVFEETTARIFRNNSASEFLRSDHPANVRAMILMHNAPELSRPWFENLEQGIRSGKAPFHLAYDAELYDYMSKHAEFAALFSDAMDCVEQLSGDSFATDFAWQRFERIIDIGGSKGSKSLTILKHHSSIEALVIDYEPVIRVAERYWPGKVDERLLARLSFQSGDMFAELPGAEGDKDIYLLSAVLHGYDDDDCIRALRNIVRVLGGSGARIAVLEMILDEVDVDLAGAMIDMQMFVGTNGRERTLAEWLDIFEKSGLLLEEVVDLRTFGKIMVLKKFIEP